MTRFEVAVSSVSRTNFVVYAKTEDEAKALARKAFTEGIDEDENNPGDPVTRLEDFEALDDEYIEITSVTVEDTGLMDE